MTKPSIKSRITQTRPVSAMTASTVGAVTSLVTIFAIKAFWTAILAHVSTNPRGTSALPSHGVTWGAVFTLACEGAVSAKHAIRTSLVADDSRPAIRTLTTIPVEITKASIGAVFTGQAAVVAKRVI